MDKNIFMQNAIPAALFVALEGLYAISAMAGDGVVVLQREVPVRPEFHDEAPGHATSIDVSPDDKVVQAVNSQRSNLKPTELGDAASGATGNISGTVDGVVTGALALNGLPVAIMRSSGQ